jgi:endo-1,4-beta-mannosidase
MDYSQIKGFNYQPSYGSSGFELWQKFDSTIIEKELGLGKKYFPGMNAIRLWLSWDSFIRNPHRFEADFETVLATASRYDLLVMPVLFNRWHDAFLDYGGIYIDHFLPRVSWVQHERMFEPYLEVIVGKHASDPRIFAWDLCNEPFSYSCAPEEIPDIVKAEYDWLKGLYNACKALGAAAPITVGIHSGHGLKGIQQIEPISDLLSIHPYWTADSPPHSKADFVRLLDDYIQFASKTGKPLLATETCWGALDDMKRVDIIKYTLTELWKRQIGWLVYLLHHSLIADAHRPEYGPIGPAGNLSFIEADGSLRPGHTIFNDF